MGPRWHWCPGLLKAQPTNGKLAGILPWCCVQSDSFSLFSFASSYTQLLVLCLLLPFVGTVALCLDKLWPCIHMCSGACTAQVGRTFAPGCLCDQIAYGANIASRSRSVSVSYRQLEHAAQSLCKFACMWSCGHPLLFFYAATATGSAPEAAHKEEVRMATSGEQPRPMWRRQLLLQQR